MTDPDPTHQRSTGPGTSGPGTPEPRLSLASRIYRVLLWLLPPAIRRADAAEMVLAFDAMWRAAGGRAARARLAARVFGRLPVVIVLEWIDVSGITRMREGWEMTGWTNHLRFALRTLRKAPAFAVTTVLLIALGVGAVTTIFTLVDHVLLRPLPYPAADRLVTIENGSHSALVFREIQNLDEVETWVSGYTEDANLTGEGDPIRIEQAFVSEGFFPFFGARPEVGRVLVDDDVAAGDAAVLSNATWRNVFGADPAIVGSTLRVDGESVTVVGVLDESFVPPQHIVTAGTDLYRPIDWSIEAMNDPGYHMLEVAGTLAPGASRPVLQERLDAVSARMGAEYPDEMMNRDGTPDPLPLAGLQDATVQRVRAGLNLLLGAVALLLLVACLNVAHLFLARGLGRVQEMAVRRALGAGPGGLIQQLLVESIVVGATGGLVGLGLAWVGLNTFMALNPAALPGAASVTVDLRVAAFAAGVSLVTSVLFGLLPALRTIGGDVTHELKGASRGSTSGKGTQRLRSTLVVVEVALSLVLVAQAALLLKSFNQVRAHDPGFDPQGVWTIPLTPTGHETPEEYVVAMDAVLAGLQALPGVSQASYGLTQPFEITGNSRCCWSSGRVQVDGEVYEGMRLMLHPVSVGYFETLAMPLVAGTVWTAASEMEQPIPAVATERLAVGVFGSAEAAIGRVVGNPDSRQFRVVGVAADAKHYGLDQPDQTALYVPMSILPFTITMAHMAIRTAGDAPDGFSRTLREAIWQVAPDMPVPTVRPMSDWMWSSMSGRRFDSAIFGTFGVAALLLAAAGLYGTLLYNVRQQRRELGIRLALGAARERVERDVVGRGLRLAGIGSVLGIVTAWWMAGLLESRLYEVGRGDPLALGGAALALLVSAALASWLPARRAGRTDPIETLKAE